MGRQHGVARGHADRAGRGARHQPEHLHAYADARRARDPGRVHQEHRNCGGSWRAGNHGGRARDWQRHLCRRGCAHAHHPDSARGHSGRSQGLTGPYHWPSEPCSGGLFRLLCNKITTKLRNTSTSFVVAAGYN